MFNPVSTYRIQFNKGFTFKHLQQIIPYLHRLGITTIYASPIFEATPGSTHGYDVINPLNINPEIGTLEELRNISRKLRELNISWLQDIVPNHMAFHPNNAWLMDVLEKGRKSAYASFFDIEWNSNIYNGRIMVPFLGVPFNEAIAQKQIQLAKKDGKFWLMYFDQQYPAKIDSPEKFTAKHIVKVNNDPQLLIQIADKQAYQLCHWQETDRQINYRRFFTVNGLICLNMQYEEVFLKYHQFIKQLLDEGIFQGLRVDHIDGLYDPEGYLKRLREFAGPEVYITVEKILEAGEDFPINWHVQGNTGYDFLAIVNNLFTNQENKALFTNNYKKLDANKKSVEQRILHNKAFILKQHMAGELENLYQLFKSLKLVTPEELVLVENSLKEAIAQLLIYCPVYRFYGNELPFKKEEVSAIESVFGKVIKSHRNLQSALQLLRTVLLERTQKADADYNMRALSFYQRCMQFTGPLMAKGVEDTLMYTYNRFIGHNEVGDTPEAFGIKSKEFHQLMIDRQRNWPLGINATSTHDTKRGEDVRARLNVLTDIGDEWFEMMQLWQKQHPKLTLADMPDNNDKYFIYQTILGAHPMPQTDDDFGKRMQDYMPKALREGKNNSDWAHPNEVYETKTKQFIAALLENESSFKKTFKSFQERITDYGIVNSLAQVLLKFTCPGIPDTYQGCELWDLSLVDPDNRRAVDYEKRETFLRTDINHNEEFWKQLWEQRYNGQIKLCLTERLLSLRSAMPDVFTKGDYFPLTIKGKYKSNLLAFARQFENSWYVTVVPLHTASISATDANLSQIDWDNTQIVLPEAAPREWQNILSNTKGFASQGIQVSVLFKGLPVALLKLNRPDDRGAGLLMHITSLPSAYGVGDVGPEAYKFIDFLFHSGQRYWQMLPVNPVDAGAAYSPYSASSSMAGNVLLISPEMLMNDGWLTNEDIKAYILPSTNHVDFDNVDTAKTQLFNKAYQNFIRSGNTIVYDFEQFKSLEAHWLDDYALYQVLKQVNQNQPWYKWADDIKTRKTLALKRLAKEHAEATDKEKWLQYIFNRQWQELKAYAVKKGITLFGDMPFYISYDSVDVWTHTELFKLDKKGNIAGIAGVPPDYFSAEGQLWGMPVYNWDVLKQQDYDWWLQRIRKNLEYFDLIRLDHFRAFSAYWEVPRGEQTAINGKWVAGPGSDFFNSMKKELGHLPFVAEDLGDIDEEVIRLRNQFALPGMNVLQFAFGGDMPQSAHIPHNYTVNSFAYTGTHDNNTLKGWYMQDADNDSRNAIKKYTGQKVSVNNVCSVLTKLCYASVAKAAILPVQDILELDGSHRMNMPASVKGNWTWRINKSHLTEELAQHLASLVWVYNR